uniref:Eukaryotic translation initiation factor 3 subunit C n=1 Tax=Rousettus aegyptiacus TaxID=9407 RepID=A0A7J8F0L5_ROUAE|nr:hypothetical protein HJG63_012281 [Rousettus aegyptiacus]
MSRFFTTGSDSESESSLSGEELVTKPVGGNYGKQPLLLSEDEEDTKRVVRSAKDKRFEELTNLIRTIRNAMKIRDVTKCLEEFELLGKAYGKAKSIVDKEGVPRFYIRILADLEDYLNELWEDKEGKKKMNKNNAKALSTLRQKIRKYNRDFESHITNYKQNPEQSADEDAEKNEEDSEGSSDEDEDEDGVSAATFLKKKSEAPSGESRKFLKKLEDEDEDSEDSEDDEDWDTGSTSSDSDSEEEEGKQTVLASKFLKNRVPATEEDKKAAEKKREDKAKKKHDRKSKRLDEDQVENEGEDSAVLMERLCKYIYAKDRTDRIRTCAILCHIYHHALHSRWYQARDLMLMSHLQDNIQHADPPVQILYNRTMVQLGICAFRQGLTKDAHNALLDIQSSGRAKELLGQGLLLRSLQERNQEQEKVERRRQVPFHLHINLELLECVYLVSAMLLEIPYMAAHESDARRRMISKQFHHQLRVGERQPLLGPPESMREHVVAASKAMKMGDWKTCHSFIINEKMNGKVWDLFPEADKVRTMLVRKIQEESLRTYLFTYSSVYDSISMETLSDMFELDLPTVHSIISKMIINEELMASLDQPTQTVVMHRTEPTAQQNLALQLAEKLGSLVENNERVFDHKQGTYGGYFRDQKDGYRKNEGYMRRGGYRQQQSQTAY